MNPRRERLRAWAVVAAFLALTLGPMVWGNVGVRKGGVLDDTLLKADDPYAAMDRRVRTLGSRGLVTGDGLSFVIPAPGGVTADALRQVQWLTEQAKEAFPEYGVLSLATVPHYRDTGEELLHDPHITAELVARASANPGWDAEVWRQQIRQDAAVYGILVGRDFDYAVVLVLLPVNYDEIQVFRRAVELLEQRPIPDWEWLVKTGIRPAEAFQGVLPAGWVMARGLMDAALTADILQLSSVGLGIVGIAFFLSFVSARQALLATIVVLLGLVWTRGSLGLLQLAGADLAERVYFLLVCTAVIVSGISFTERKFHAYNDARLADPGRHRAAAWRQARSVDRVISVTALIAILNFATLYQIQIRGILEVGVLSALGIAYLLVLVRWFLPALHTLVGGEEGTASASHAGRLGKRWNALLTTVVVACHRVVDPHPAGSFAWAGRARTLVGLSLAGVLAAVALVCVDTLVLRDRGFQFLEVKTRPLEYIRDSLVYQASLVLNRPGSGGFDRLPVLVMPAEPAPGHPEVLDPAFLAEAQRFQEAARRLPEVREAFSVVNILTVVSRETYGRPLPASPQEAHDVLQTVEWDLGPRVREQLWFDGGLVVFVSGAMDDSNDAGQLGADVLGLAENGFPALDVAVFGKLGTYPQSDRYIREGKPLNVISSQWLVVAVTALWVWGRNRRGHALHPWRAGFAMSLPFLFASAATFFVMVVLRVPLDQATACITALAINAAVDFGLYLVADFQASLQGGASPREALRFAMVQKGKIVVVDLVLNCLCFAPLLTSRFLPVARLGWLMIVMLIACGVGTLLVMASVLPWCACAEARVPDVGMERSVA
ncbi:MAG: hypothetical protein ACNA8S_09920 [Deferrisomatales bacterium]